MAEQPNLWRRLLRPRWPADRAIVYSYLCAILALLLAGDLFWVLRNEVLIGRDAGAHLHRTLAVAEIISSGAPDRLFQAFTFHSYRPPGLYLAAQPFYALLGPSMDHAQLVNITLAGVVLVLVFRYGLRMGGPRLALAAALMTGLWPLLTAMSRLFYLELFVTALTLLGLLALLNSDGFANRRWSLFWGVAIGVGLLVKWTMPLYLAAPLFYVLWRQPWRREAWAAARGHRIDWRRALFALGVAALLAALWYLPARAHARHLLLGDWLLVGWALLWGAFLYVARLPATPVANLAGGLLAALSVASLWYLPRLDFITELLNVGFGGYGSHEPFDLFRLSNYTRYFRYLIRFDLGLLAALLILPLGLWPWLKRLRAWRQAAPDTALLWWSLAGAWAVLSLLTQDNERNLVPLIPVIALLLLRGLHVYPPRLAGSLAGLWLLTLALHWGILTFDAFTPLHQATRPLWGISGFLQRPASGPTAPDYWIAPDVLATVNPPPGGETILGMLINTPEIHRGPFRYLIDLDDLSIDLLALTEVDSPGWPGVIESSWLLFKDGENDIEPPGLAVLERIHAGDPMFDALYAEARRYPLPDGDTAYLYRRNGPGEPRKLPGGLERTAPLAAQVEQWMSRHATLLFGHVDLAVWLGIHDPPIERMALIDELDDVALDALEAATGTLLAVLSYNTPALQHWLDDYAYRALEIGDDLAALAVYGRPTAPLVALPVEDEWDDLRFVRLAGRTAVEPGEVIPLEADVAGQVDGSRKMSLRLLGVEGEPAAQTDLDLWPHLRTGLFVSPATPPGRYRLVAIVYDRVTLEPIPGPMNEPYFSVTSVVVQRNEEPSHE